MTPLPPATAPPAPEFEADSRVPLRLIVNGVERHCVVRMHDSLLDVLRREGFTAAKRVCETADCGACSVLLDGMLVDSCALLALQASERRVDTIEGLAGREGLHPLQDAFLRHAAAQCGFCIPGMILTLCALLDRDPDASLADIREAVTLCRCTGYVKPIEATLDYQRQLRAAEP